MYLDVFALDDVLKIVLKVFQIVDAGVVLTQRGADIVWMVVFVLVGMWGVGFVEFWGFVFNVISDRMCGKNVHVKEFMLVSIGLFRIYRVR